MIGSVVIFIFLVDGFTESRRGMCSAHVRHSGRTVVVPGPSLCGRVSIFFHQSAMSGSVYPTLAWISREKGQQQKISIKEILISNTDITFSHIPPTHALTLILVMIMLFIYEKLQYSIISTLSSLCSSSPSHTLLIAHIPHSMLTNPSDTWRNLCPLSGTDSQHYGGPSKSFGCYFSFFDNLDDAGKLSSVAGVSVTNNSSIYTCTVYVQINCPSCGCVSC